MAGRVGEEAKGGHVQLTEEVCNKMPLRFQGSATRSAWSRVETRVGCWMLPCCRLQTREVLLTGMGLSVSSQPQAAAARTIGVTGGVAKT